MPDALPLDGPNITRIPDMNTSGAMPMPNQIRFFQLDFLMRKKGASLKITRSKVVELGASPSQTDVDTALANALHDTGPKRQIGFPRMDRKVKFKSGKDRLGIGLAAPHELPAPDSCPAADVCLYVIALAQHPRIKVNGVKKDQWQFTAARPFSLGHAEIADPATGQPTGHPADKFIAWHKPWNDDRQETGGGNGPVNPRWAGFVMYDKMLRDETGLAEYLIRYNSHIELLDNEGGRYIPIIVDPDVGHPGGTSSGEVDPNPGFP
ncbi:hypothetical protein HME9302_00129 [Alteripontixanthobacter maritimus]|uniref:Uncharacterized protein n=1 Tax=Alteripontixanthobacter maritimus TaxID=2161824 RepID=A0A369Q228_9SPHN|nr:hypothetical protein [Alteripontixanthobacter maritimus]RDC58953.1 hypothetical protein HME9302_00129 [Alteripontixanthobacter maritimus]